jgi:hypothetical protein
VPWLINICFYLIAAIVKALKKLLFLFFTGSPPLWHGM